MSKISVKYTAGATEEDIKQVERKYSLKRESRIPVLRIYGYMADDTTIKKLEKENTVEYVEKQQDMTIASS